MVHSPTRHRRPRLLLLSPAIPMALGQRAPSRPPPSPSPSPPPPAATLLPPSVVGGSPPPPPLPERNPPLDYSIPDASMATPPGPPWAELQHDLLVAIMTHLDSPDLLSGGAPRTCSSWRAAARDPVAWRRVDLRDWTALASDRRGGGTGPSSRRLPIQAALAAILEFAVTLAGGRIEAVLFPEFADEEHLLFLAERCPNLYYFHLPSAMDYHQFCKAIGKLHSLKGMAVDESLIDYEVLLHVQHCCPDFVELKVSALYVDEEMASVICSSLPRLKKLEMPNSDMSSAAIIKFLDCLDELEYLDISGYETSAISSTVLEKASRLKVFLWNSKFELGEFIDCSNCGEHNIDPKEPCECIMESKVMDWLAGSSQAP